MRAVKGCRGIGNFTLIIFSCIHNIRVLSTLSCICGGAREEQTISIAESRSGRDIILLLYSQRPTQSSTDYAAYVLLQLLLLFRHEDHRRVVCSCPKDITHICTYIYNIYVWFGKVILLYASAPVKNPLIISPVSTSLRTSDRV